MDGARTADDEQAARWNSAGCAWVEAQAALDEMFKPLEDQLVRTVEAESARQVLDVGCGTGSTTLAIARHLGAGGRCVGIDISDPMINAARARAEQLGTSAQFVRADAQDYAFEPGEFDALISRFGVMFFADFVAAFANLRRAASANALFRFIAWRSAAENPFMTTAERAAAPLLPNLPARQPNSPGQFAFADPDRVRSILEASGWGALDIETTDVLCVLPERELVRYFTRLGPVGLALNEAAEATRAQVVDVVRPAFDPYVVGAEVRFTAACWTVSARALP